VCEGEEEVGDVVEEAETELRRPLGHCEVAETVVWE